MPHELRGGRVTRVAKVVVDVAWWVTIAGAVFLAGTVLLWPLVGDAGTQTLLRVRVSIPDEAAEGLLPGAAAGVRLENVRGLLELRARDWWEALLGILVVLPGVAAVLLGLRLLRSFLRDVLSAEVFTQANARRLSRLGWLLLAAGVAVPVLRFGFAQFIVRRAGLSGASLRVELDTFNLLIPGLLVLVVAAAWRYGVELQRDRDLTV